MDCLENNVPISNCDLPIDSYSNSCIQEMDFNSDGFNSSVVNENALIKKDELPTEDSKILLKSLSDDCLENKNMNCDTVTNECITLSKDILPIENCNLTSFSNACIPGENNNSVDSNSTIPCENNKYVTDGLHKKVNNLVMNQLEEPLNACIPGENNNYVDSNSTIPCETNKYVNDGLHKEVNNLVMNQLEEPLNACIPGENNNSVDSNSTIPCENNKYVTDGLHKKVNNLVMNQLEEPLNACIPGENNNSVDSNSTVPCENNKYVTDGLHKKVNNLVMNQLEEPLNACIPGENNNYVDSNSTIPCENNKYVTDGLHKKVNNLVMNQLEEPLNACIPGENNNSVDSNSTIPCETNKYVTDGLHKEVNNLVLNPLEEPLNACIPGENNNSVDSNSTIPCETNKYVTDGLHKEVNNLVLNPLEEPLNACIPGENNNSVDSNSTIPCNNLIMNPLSSKCSENDILNCDSTITCNEHIYSKDNSLVETVILGNINKASNSSQCDKNEILISKRSSSPEPSCSNGEKDTEHKDESLTSPFRRTFLRSDSEIEAFSSMPCTETESFFDENVNLIGDLTDKQQNVKDEILVSKYSLSPEPSCSNGENDIEHKDSSLTSHFKGTFLRSDSEIEAFSSIPCTETESFFHETVNVVGDLTNKQQNVTDEFDIIMCYRKEIEELSQKCISKILAQKEKIIVEYGTVYHKVVQKHSLNLTLQQSQFESITSEAKTQLSQACSLNTEDISKSCKKIMKIFKKSYRLYKKLYPANAFREHILSSLEDNQVLIINADSCYSFSNVVPIFLKSQYPDVPLVCCENSEFTRSWLCESLIDFLGDKVIVNLDRSKNIKNQVICLTEEELVESLLYNQHIFQQKTYLIVNVPLVRSINCDILLANILDLLKLNENSKLVLLISPYARVKDYRKYFSNWTLVSVLKTECLTFPAKGMWKNNALTPSDDYVIEVVKTVTAILVLKEVGDILVFLPQLEDLEQAAEIIDHQLLELQIENVEPILMHENTICDFDFYSFVLATECKRRIFLVTNCAETLFLPSIKHVVDCGLRNMYLYDSNAKMDRFDTSFISCKNADLRKSLAGVCQPGFCYRIYSKNDYLKDMEFDDRPDILLVSPTTALLKLFQYQVSKALNTELVTPISKSVKLDALKILESCGAVKKKVLTTLGGNMSLLPFDVTYSKLILLALEHDIGFEAIVLISFFTCKENIFLVSEDKKQQRMIEAKKLELLQNNSDTMTYLYIFKLYMENNFSKEFCDTHFINYETLDRITSKIFHFCQIVSNCLDVDINRDFSTDSYLGLSEILFYCFQDNLCVFTGHTLSGYKILSSSSFASIHSSSLIYQWQILPQFIIYNHVDPTSNNLVHVTAIPDDVIMTALQNETLKYNFEDLFEKILLKRIVEPIGEEVISELASGSKFETIQNQVKGECGSDHIFLDLCAEKGCIDIYALPDCMDCAQCIVEDIVKNMLGNILSETQIETVELKKGQSKVYIEVNWSKGAVASSLSQKSKNYQPLNSSVFITKDFIQGCMNFPYFMSISWVRRCCSGEGFVTFQDNGSFSEARKLGMKYIQVLGTEVFVQLSKSGQCQLRLNGLPPETCCESLEKVFNVLLPNSKIEKVELKYRNSFETSDEELEKIKVIISTKCLEYDLLDYCDIVIPKPEPSDINMAAKIYTYNIATLQFVSEVISSELTRIKKTITEINFYTHVECSSVICNALAPRFTSELEHQVSYLNNTMYKHGLKYSFDIEGKTDDTVALNISANNSDLLQLLHQTINNLLEGDILSNQYIKGLENLFFYGGHVWLKNLEKTENLYIVENRQAKEIRLYGSEESCNSAKCQIVDFLEDAENDVMVTIPLCGDIYSNLLLKAIIKEYGVNLEVLIESCSLRTTVLDIKARQLLLRGSRDAVEKAENCIRTLSESLDITNVIPGQSQESCPACLCPASNLAFRLEHCGHLYCIECIQALIEQAQFPLHCCADKCSKDIVLKDIKKILKNDSNKIKDLVEKSMKDYLERNQTAIVFCPTADCNMFFHKQDISGKTVICSLCQNEICTQCNVLYHRGFTCEMYQNSKNDPDYSFKAWQKTTTQCKQCPRCKTAIEKISGCNRMICRSCKAPFCWICITEFRTEQEVYNHIHSAHRGMLHYIGAMSGLFGIAFLISILTCHALVIPKSDGPSKRVHQNSLSDEDHYKEEEIHNAEYDHEAFLGEKDAKTFDELSPKESQRRLGIIVDKIDTDKDGFVSMQELKEWIQHTQRKYIVDDSERQWNGLNPENHPEITWKLYKKTTYGFAENDADESGYNYKDMIERDLRRWKKADQDQSGSLNKKEFIDFVHPEESEHMKDLVVIETMEDIDKDRDGKVSMEEYIGDMYSDADNDVEEEQSWVQPEKDQFIQFRDKDKSGFMEFEEVKDWILPDDFDNSESEAKHLIYESDVDRDNQLSKEEILNKFDLFVGSQATDFGEALVRHDEF
ncbi:hypothetical protein JTE90_012273 [Oedothorax gibbosus]|uniref:Reticulocalbin-3 n=1 Tax=Oedothorax gibbosus TaxID=931172 RepID=A0AAV6VKM1_9ARAC|nr:hypothetical protein JTE90_012273 [Oedothorax gibbosus]